MSIRTKLLLVLVGFALVPMLVAFGVGQLSTRLVGARLSDQAQRQLVAEAQDRLLQYVNSASNLAGSQALTVELIVTIQAESMARALAEGLGPIGTGPPVFWSGEDFDRGRREPPGVQTPEAYRSRDGGAHRVSFDAASVLLAPGVRAEDVPGDLDAAGRLAEVFAILRRFNPQLILFQYACTASGVHASYPGHGGYPEGYEPRDRPWYRLATDDHGLGGGGRTRGLVWGPPMVDAVTGRVVLTVSAPAPLPDGSIGGVTAVDILIDDLLAHVSQEPTWTDDEEVFIVSLVGEDPRVGDDALEVYATRAYDGQRVDWRGAIELETFEMDDPAVGRTVVGDLSSGRSGVVRAMRHGRETLCAYAPIVMGGEETAAALVYTVPYADVVTLATRIDDEFWAVTVGRLATNATIALVVLGVVVVVAVRGSRAVTEPVRRLADAVGAVSSGDLDARADVARGDELGRLAADFNAMIPKLRDRVTLRQSLDLAMEVQQSLLPKAGPSLDGFDVEGRSVYCDETGGDYYDFLELDQLGPGRLGVVMGDVTGHGIAAALLMTTARALLRSRVSQPGALADQLRDINRELAADNQHGRFMTMFYLLIDAGEGRLRWVSAGHDPAIVYDPADGSFHELDGDIGGIPLGIDGSWPYEEGERPMVAPGSVIVLGTDGIWEQRDAADEQFGKDRLRAAIRDHAAGTADDICDAILAAVDGHRGATPQQDDVTLVVIKRR